MVLGVIVRWRVCLPHFSGMRVLMVVVECCSSSVVGKFPP